ncbi:uncharacterized protein G2W53_026084 [Senna tora]|uniref:Uncharacterized protein n=1 Tax=Senna tora TaxID=362788 RepID=A0A834TGN1_9FABA|nr:uncharacterized protein G2W53_026084 [Senna tora]
MKCKSIVYNILLNDARTNKKSINGRVSAGLQLSRTAIFHCLTYYNTLTVTDEIFPEKSCTIPFAGLQSSFLPQTSLAGLQSSFLPQSLSLAGLHSSFPQSFSLVGLQSSFLPQYFSLAELQSSLLPQSFSLAGLQSSFLPHAGSGLGNSEGSKSLGALFFSFGRSSSFRGADSGSGSNGSNSGNSLELSASDLFDLAPSPSTTLLLFLFFPLLFFCSGSLGGAGSDSGYNDRLWFKEQSKALVQGAMEGSGSWSNGRFGSSGGNGSNLGNSSGSGSNGRFETLGGNGSNLGTGSGSNGRSESLGGNGSNSGNSSGSRSIGSPFGGAWSGSGSNAGSEALGGNGPNLGNC